MSPRMIIVEDEQDVRNVITRKFEQEGYEVLGAATGAHGLELIHSERADVILLDIRLPDMGAILVCRWNRRATAVYAALAKRRMWSCWLLRTRQRNARMWSAPRRFQRMPACLSRCATTTLQAASAMPLPIIRPRVRKS